ncbi:hypothetical protein Hypma_011104 [Hypsizygus marmoreus]|uniref:Uncharacterized protein n=1 Tax=Hypsizygus marmoreus TaxID=39966 RepID=A0A369JNG2_HYPMA|nr:hypothetical protein Hypma_011104 [Hypsizygus marmoreus]
MCQVLSCSFPLRVILERLNNVVHLSLYGNFLILASVTPSTWCSTFQSPCIFWDFLSLRFPGNLQKLENEMTSEVSLCSDFTALPPRHTFCMLEPPGNTRSPHQNCGDINNNRSVVKANMIITDDRGQQKLALYGSFGYPISITSRVDYQELRSLPSPIAGGSRRKQGIVVIPVPSFSRAPTANTYTSHHSIIGKQRLQRNRWEGFWSTMCVVPNGQSSDSSSSLPLRFRPTDIPYSVIYHPSCR